MRWNRARREVLEMPEITKVRGDIEPRVAALFLPFDFLRQSVVSSESGLLLEETKRIPTQTTLVSSLGGHNISKKYLTLVKPA